MLGAEEIKDQKSLEAWLYARPKATRLAEAALLAGRCALRVFPLFSPKAKISASNLGNWVKFTARNLIVARSATFEPTAEVVKAANSVRVSQSYAVFTANSEGLDTSNYSSSSRAAAAMSQFGDVSDAMTAVNIAAAAAVSEDIWESVQLDANDLDFGYQMKRVFAQPLWQNVPNWWLEELNELQKMLHSTDMKPGNWDIWLDWYVCLSKGEIAYGLRSSDDAHALERDIALGGRGGKFRPEFWDREPGEINREIAEWVAEARAAEVVGGDVAIPAKPDFPAQSLDATMFGLNADGRIERIAVPPEQQLLITPLQRKQYEAMRADAEALLSQGQILGDKLKTQISNLIKALPADMSHAAVFDVWRAINRLRRTWNAHVAVANLGEPHESKLELGIAEDLGDLLDTANNFSFDDPRIRQRDENSVPPQDKQSIADEKILGDALAKGALEEPEIFTPDAFDSVNAEEQNAKDAGEDAHGQQAKEQTNKTRRNWIAAMLSVFKGESGYAWKEMRSGVYKKTGELGAIAVATDVLGWTTVYPAIWSFVVNNGSALLAYVKVVYNNATLTTFLEFILKAVVL